MQPKRITVSMNWASRNVGKVLARAAVGERLVITRYGKPIGVVEPLDGRDQAKIENERKTPA